MSTTKEDLESLLQIRSLYRYFKEEGFADAFVSGEVYFSTLNTCRAHEDNRGDPNEAKETYINTHVHGKGTDPAVRSAAEGLHWPVSPNATDVSMAFNVRVTTIADAFVVCTTERLDAEMQKTFGNHCVRIDHQQNF